MSKDVYNFKEYSLDIIIRDGIKTLNPSKEYEEKRLKSSSQVIRETNNAPYIDSLIGDNLFSMCEPMIHNETKQLLEDYFSFLDFDTIILKPYESLSALAGVILIAIISRSFYLKSWSYKHYIFISLSGGVLFLMYYFWWAVFIPSLFLLALLSKDRFKNFKRITLFGLIILAISSIFLIPLIYSYFTYGIENNQAIHFIPSDFFIFVPWKVFSLRGLMYLLGLFGLIFFSKKSFVKSSLIVFIFTYLYQFFNIFYYLFGNRPIQPSKHFLFLGTAAISLGLTYLLIYLYNNKIKKLGSKYIKSLIY